MSLCLCLTLSHLLQILRLKMMQGLEEVLLDIIVQGVLEIGHLLHRLPSLEQGSTEYRTKNKYGCYDREN